MQPAAAIAQVEQQLAAAGYQVVSPAATHAAREATAALTIRDWSREIAALDGRAYHEMTLGLRIIVPATRLRGVSAARAALAALEPLAALRPQGEQHILYLSGAEQSYTERDSQLDAQLTLVFYE